MGILSSGISLVIDVIFGITGLQFGELNVAIFSLITIVPFIIWIWLTVVFYKNKKRKKESYENKKEQYLDRCDESIGLKEIYKIVKKNDEKYMNKCRGKKRSYIFISLMFAIGIIVNSYLIVSQYHAMKETGETGTDFTSKNVNSNLNETTTSVATTIVNEGVGNKGISPEEKEEMKNKTFILSEPERLEVLSDIDETKIFYVSLDEDKSKEEVKKYLDAIYGQKKRSTILESSTEEKLAAEAQSKEDVFRKL